MTIRRTLAVTAALCVLLAGCGQNKDSATTGSTAASTPSSPSSTSSSPTSPSATPTPGTSTSITTDTAPAPATSETSSPTSPRSRPHTPAAVPPAQGTKVKQRSPEDYGDAAVKAWADGDRATLSTYVSSSVRSKISGAPPAGELLRTACEGDMCSYTTADGNHRVTLTFDLDRVKAGKGGGIVGVKVA